MTKNRIALITWLYKRPEISRKVLEYYSKFPLVLIIAVGTESSHLCEGLPVNYHEMPNFPLGAKWNKAFQLTKEIECDYVLVVGSDDYLCANTMNFYLNEANLDYYRFADLFVTNEDLSESYYVTKISNCGAGFLFRKEMLIDCNYTPVPNHIKQGLDRNMFDVLLKNKSGQDISTALNGFKLIDVKSQDSMNRLDKFHLRGLPVELSLESLNQV